MGTRPVAQTAMLVAMLAACKGSSPGVTPPPYSRPLGLPTIDHVYVPAGPVTPFGSILWLDGRFLPPGSTTWLLLRGVEYARAGGEPPTITVVRTRDVEGNATDAPSVSSVASVDDLGLNAGVALDANALEPGVYAAVLRNAAGHEARFEDAFVLPPTPSVEGSESWSCATESQPPTIAVGGKDLYQIPQAHIAAALVASRTPGWDGGTLEYTVPVDSVSGCRSVPFAVPGLELCSRFVARLPEVSGPIQLSGRTELFVELGADSVFGPPTTLLPVGTAWIERPYPKVLLWDGAAVDAPLDVGVWGPALVAAGRGPTVTVEGTEIEVRGDGCHSTGVPSIESCDRLTATFPQGFAPGAHTIVVTTAAGCTGSIPFVLGPKPVVTSVTPSSVCVGRQRFTVGGEGFHRWYSIVSDGEPIPSALAIGTHQIGVRNETQPPVWSNTLPLVVTPGPPQVLDPRERLVYSGATRPVFVRAWGLTGEVTGADLVPYETGQDAPIGPPVPAQAKAVANGIEVTFAGLDAGTEYAVIVRDESPCAAYETPRRVRVTDAPVLESDDFETEVSFAWSRSDAQGDPLDWLAGDGNPGSGAGASRDAPGPDWYLTWRSWTTSRSQADLGRLRFDLRANGSGEASASPGVVLTWTVPLWGGAYRLERALPPPPAGVWTTFEVPLDDPSGWTYVNPLTGERRPATMDDLRGDLVVVGILATWWSGAASVAIDNASLELAR